MRRFKIDILMHSTETNEFGELNDEWIPFKSNIWASKSPLIGKEFYAALTTGVQVDAKFNTGFIKGVKSSMRVKCGNDIYEIIGEPVNPNSKNMELLYYCRLVK